MGCRCQERFIVHCVLSGDVLDCKRWAVEIGEGCESARFDIVAADRIKIQQLMRSMRSRDIFCLGCAFHDES